MRIALVTDYYLPTLGGVQTAVKALAELLKSSGHEVTVCCPLSQPSDDPAVVALPISRRFHPDGYPFTWPPAAAARLLASEFRDRQIELVHTHSEMFAALGGIRAAQELGLPLVHTMHGRIDVYLAEVLPLPALTTQLLAQLHRRHVPTDGIQVGADSPYTRTASARAIWRLMLAQSRASDHVIVPSAHFQAKLKAQGITTPTSVVSNSLEDTVLARIPEPTLRELKADEPLRLLWVGRLSPEKRPLVFAQAAAELGAEVVADMYGDGFSRGKVEAVGGPVRLHGSVPQSEVLRAMQTAHVLVSTSFDFDNQPMVMLEAIASGLPILFLDPDLGEVVPQGAGFLAEAPTVAALVSMVRAIRADPERLAQASAATIAARQRVSGRADGIESTYAGAIEEHQRRIALSHA